MKSKLTPKEIKDIARLIHYRIRKAAAKPPQQKSK